MSTSSPLFRFIQVELPWQLGPPDGRYLLRAPDVPEGPPTHVLVLTTLGAPERRRLGARRRPRDVSPRPDPTPVATARATVIDVGDPLDGSAPAQAWLQAAGEADLAGGLAVLNRALHAFRLADADPYLHPIGRRQSIVARVGYGEGEQVAEGLWTAARELTAPDGRRRRRGRAVALEPQARLAAMLGARQPPLVSEELALRARLDLEHDRPREAALTLLVALDAAIAELSADPHAPQLSERVAELRGQRDPVAQAAQAALSGTPADHEAETVAFALGRLEGALRARAVAGS